MIAGIKRVDVGLAMVVASAPGAEAVANVLDASAPIAGAVRWIAEPVFVFDWGAGLAYVTPSDVVAISSGAVLLIRFFAWAVSPLFAGGRK